MRGRAWPVFAAAAFVAAFLGAMRALEWGLDRAQVLPEHSVRLAGLPFIEQSIREMAAVPRRIPRIAFLGDSHMVGYPLRDRVPYRLQKDLERAARPGERWRVYDLAMPGLGPFDFYFEAAAIAAAEPSLVILPVNLNSLERRWYARFRRPESAGWLGWRRLPEALSLPLQWDGLTADQIVTHIATRRAVGFERWRLWQLEQARVPAGWKQLEERLAASATVHRATVRAALMRREFEPKRNRFRRDAIESQYVYLLKGVTRDHPIVRVLDRTLATFERNQTSVLVVVLPWNVVHLRTLGIDIDRPLRVTIGTLRAMAETHGAMVLDLHDALSDEQFRDAPGHLAIGPSFHGPAWLAGELVEPVRRLVERGG